VGSQAFNLKTWIDRHAIVLAIGVCGVVITLGIIVAVMVSGLNNTPRWWNEGDQLAVDHPELVLQAERLENAITTQLTAVRDVENPQWAVAITAEQANAWLTVRLRETIITHQGEDVWPSELGQVRVGIENDQLIIGARTVSASGSVVIWAKISLRVDAQGDLVASVFSAHAGTTRLPIRVMGFIGSSHQSGSMFRVGSGKLELGDGRQAELLGLRVHNGQLELMMKTSVSE